jgi:hypothetical protein
MKSMTAKMMITAAALAIASGVASAQTLKAEIPFAFRAGEKVMAPGNYTVRISSEHRYLVISNYETKQHSMLPTGIPGDPNKAWAAKGEPVMSFECGTSRCELTRLWSGPGTPALSFAHRSLGRDEKASIIEVRLSKTNAD